MSLFGFFKHWKDFINMKNDPIALDLGIDCRIHGYLFKKTNFTQNKFMKSEL